MASVTSEFELPYPESTDAPEVWTDIQNLAEGVEGVLTEIVTGLTNHLHFKPACRLVAASTQSIPHNTATALSFTNGEEFDENGMHSNVSNQSRITLTESGMYTLRGTVYMAGSADYTLIVAHFAKNGSALAPAARQQPNTVNNARSVSPQPILVTGDAGDYFELFVTHTNGASASKSTNQSSQFSSCFEVVWEREAPL